MSAARVPFVSLVPGEDRQDGAAVRAAIDRVLASGWFVLGPEVEAFEAEFAALAGAAHAVGVGSGTDALALILRALDIGRGDEVITTPLSAAYTALAVLMTGARPVFIDVDPARLTLDPDRVEAAIGPRTRAILPVHLYGQPADMEALSSIAMRHGLPLVEDCCQAHLASAAGRPVGTIGAAGAFSFYPTKNLAALGDGGAVVTNDGTLAERIRWLRNGGQTHRYRHELAGVNSRLDELQAAVLRARLPRLGEWTDERRRLARHYRRGLQAVDTVAPLPECDQGHVYHLFVVRADDRDAVRSDLEREGIETIIHYPVPIPMQPAMAGSDPADCFVAARACREVLSLPLRPGLTEGDVHTVVGALARHRPGSPLRGRDRCAP
jgi:dTDP-3-amino-3,4,6-trideoxy-alpha-D-glucose transaminase